MVYLNIFSAFDQTSFGNGHIELSPTVEEMLQTRSSKADDDDIFYQLIAEEGKQVDIFKHSRIFSVGPERDKVERKNAAPRTLMQKALTATENLLPRSSLFQVQVNVSAKGMFPTSVIRIYDGNTPSNPLLARLR